MMRALGAGLAAPKVDLYGPIGSRAGFLAALRGGAWRGRVRNHDSHAFEYSNVGFALLVMAAESETGRTIADILDETVVKPLGLRDTGFELDGPQRGRLAPPVAGGIPWLWRRGAAIAGAELGPALAGVGSLKSSAHDVAKFLEERYWRLVDGGRAALLVRRPMDCGGEMLYRFGMTYGGSSFVALVPERRLAVVMLRNSTDWTDPELFEWVEAICRDMKKEER